MLFLVVLALLNFVFAKNTTLIVIGDGLQAIDGYNYNYEYLQVDLQPYESRNFTIECQSSQQLLWYHPNMEEDDLSDLIIVNSTTKHGTFLSRLTLMDAGPLHSGSYICLTEDNSDWDSIYMDFRTVMPFDDANSRNFQIRRIVYLTGHEKFALLPCRKFPTPGVETFLQSLAPRRRIKYKTREEDEYTLNFVVPTASIVPKSVFSCISSVSTRRINKHGGISYTKLTRTDFLFIYLKSVARPLETAPPAVLRWAADDLCQTPRVNQYRNLVAIIKLICGLINFISVALLLYTLFRCCLLRKKRASKN